jgi:hypothetical protein
MYRYIGKISDFVKGDRSRIPDLHSDKHNIFTSVPNPDRIRNEMGQRIRIQTGQNSPPQKKKFKNHV